MANVEDLWNLTLSKEEAAERASRVRNARRRDDQRAPAPWPSANSAPTASHEPSSRRRRTAGSAPRSASSSPASATRRRDKKGKDQDKRGGDDMLDRLGY